MLIFYLHSPYDNVTTRLFWGCFMFVRKRLKGTVHSFKMHPGGTVPSFKMHPRGTVPSFKMHPPFKMLNIDPLNPEIFKLSIFQKFSIQNFQRFSLFSNRSNSVNIWARKRFFFLKQVRILPEIDWLCYQWVRPAKMLIQGVRRELT